MLTVKKTSIEKIEKYEADAWQVFQGQEDYLNPFFSLSFARAVAESGKHVQVLVIKDCSEIVGFFPYHKKGNGIFSFLGEAERLGGDMSDYFGFVLKPGLIISPNEILSAVGLTRISFSHLPQALISRGMKGHEPRVGMRIILEKDGDRYWNALVKKDKKFTTDTERREKAVIKDLGPLVFCFHQADISYLDTLIAEKRQQYNRTGVQDALLDVRNRILLRQLHGIRNPDCSGVLSTLYAGSTWVASHFGLFANGILHYWFPVYNLQLRKYSPGRLLLKQFILRAEELGISVIDRGEGDSSAKRDFANFEHHYFRGEWDDGSIRALCCKMIQHCLWKIKAFGG